MCRVVHWLAGFNFIILAGCWSSSSESLSAPQAAPLQASLPRAASSAALPPLTQSTYQNTRPHVRYVDDEQCAECHQQIADSYRAHPMGRSMWEIAVRGHDDLEIPTTASFEADGLTYTVSWDGKRMVHTEQRLDDTGRKVFEKSEEVAYAVGAGSHGRSYLIRRGDSLWMSPITWYPQQQRWALSPNYEIYNHHFTRPVLPDCLYCHSNRANHRAGTVNVYERPPFDGLSIGCQRCHGPGELHVQRRSQLEPFTGAHDDSIVNPRDLDAPLLDGVCQQCHLSGEVRIVRRGRDAYDYRPGLPWHEYMAVFVESGAAGELATVTSHDAQMRVSQCFQSSSGKMHCISCHNPHSKPGPDKAANYFRQRCFSCHTDESCTETQQNRDTTAPADNCIACHMPPRNTDVRHVAITDHRILRRPAEAPARPSPGVRGSIPLTFFHTEIDRQHPEAMRDLAVALMQYAPEHPQALNHEHLAMIRRTLAAAVERDPKDAAAAEALAHVLSMMNRPAEAAMAVHTALQHAPHDEQIQGAAVFVALQNQHWDAAQRHAGALVSLNPAQVRYHVLHAQAAVGCKDLNSAIHSCEAVLTINPADRNLRQLYIQLLTALGRTDDAQRQREILQGSVP